MEENNNLEAINSLSSDLTTREKITRARLEVEGAGEQNAKTSIYNKKGLTITNE